MRHDPIHLTGRFFVLLSLVSFFLPWIRISPDALRQNTVEVVRNLAKGSKGLGPTMLWMRGEEWGEMWADPVDGFSGFQLAFGARSGTPRVKAQLELASVALDGKENRPLLGWLMLIPVLTLLAWVALVLRRAPHALLGLTSAGLLGMYGMLRWKMSEAYTDRLLAQLQLGPGWWGTVYGILGLGIVCLLFMIQGRRGRHSSEVRLF